MYLLAGISTFLVIPALLLSGIFGALFFLRRGDHYGPLNDLFFALSLFLLILPVIAVNDLANEQVGMWFDAVTASLDVDDKWYPTLIKWSRDLRNEFNRGKRIVYNDAHRVRSLYRPFVVKHHFANFTMNDVLTRNHYEMFGEDLTQQNKVLNLCSNGRYFYTLASDKLTDLHFTGDTQCLPLYRYTEDGERVSNITQWGIDHINGHYRQEWGEEFESMAGEDGITAEEIFAYTYAVLHDPAYRHEYAMDLLREFPACPCTRTSTTGSRRARSCWTCTSGSSPPSRTCWSGTTVRTPFRPGPSCGPTSPGGR